MSAYFHRLKRHKRCAVWSILLLSASRVYGRYRISSRLVVVSQLKQFPQTSAVQSPLRMNLCDSSQNARLLLGGRGGSRFRTTLHDVVPAAHKTVHGLHIVPAQACPPGLKRLICTSSHNRLGLSASRLKSIFQ